MGDRENIREDVSFHGDTERERDDIQQEHVGSLSRRSLAGEDTSLNSGTVGDSLVGVDALLELLAVEEVGQELLDARDTGRTTDQHNVVNLGLLKGGVL